MTQSKTIGITGGVGAGKSTILSYIQQHYQVSVISADEVGKALMEPGCTVYQALVAYYGDVILHPDGTINRPKLAEIGLKDEESQKVINSIEHPLIREEILNQIQASDAPIVFLEAALLLEGNLTEICDEVWVVTANEETRIQRLMQDRGYTEENCRRIISRQLSDEAFREIADVLIQNDRKLSSVYRQVSKEMKRIGAEKC